MCARTQVTGDSLSVLVPQLSNLQSLDLFQSYDFDDVQLSKCLDFLGSVTFLDLRGTVVSEEGIQQLARLQNLQKLCLASKTEVRVEQHLCVVSHLTQLTSLAINNCRLVSFDLMASIASLKLLRELDISNNGQVRCAAGWHPCHRCLSTLWEPRASTRATESCASQRVRAPRRPRCAPRT